jgi:hypothetical protein
MAKDDTQNSRITPFLEAGSPPPPSKDLRNGDRAGIPLLRSKKRREKKEKGRTSEWIRALNAVLAACRGISHDYVSSHALKSKHCYEPRNLQMNSRK